MPSGICMEIHTEIVQKRKKKPSHNKGTPRQPHVRPPKDLISEAIRDVEQTIQMTGDPSEMQTDGGSLFAHCFSWCLQNDMYIHKRDVNSK